MLHQSKHPILSIRRYFCKTVTIENLIRHLCLNRVRNCEHGYQNLNPNPNSSQLCHEYSVCKS